MLVSIHLTMCGRCCHSRDMSTETRKSLEDVIAELHREAATALAMVDWTQREKPWRRHDVRIYRERAETALQAVKHLEEAL